MLPNISNENLLIGYMCQDVPIEGLITQLGGDPRSNPGAVLRELQRALESGAPGYVEGALFLACHFGLSRRWAGVLCQLLLADWHCQHENIASSLQDIRAPSSVESLYRAASVQHAYLSYDDSSPFAHKCVWALFDIGTPEAIEKLHLLSRSDREDIRDYARKRLDHLAMRPPGSPLEPYRLARDRNLREPIDEVTNKSV